MYEQHFGLKERPFSISPDPRFFYLSPQHSEALARCQYAIAQKMGLAAVFGDIGMGKTSIARRLLQQLTDDSDYQLGTLVHPNLPSPFQFLKQIRREFGLDKPRRSMDDELNDFQRYLIAQHRAGKTTVLFVDEAQNLKPPFFEVLRQFLNFETNTEKLLQIVLFGQNELVMKVDRLPELKDRVTMFAALSSLRREDTDKLIDFRWKVAGGDQHPFDEAALASLYRLSGGRPRQLCKLCDNALIRAYSAKSHAITADTIERVAVELRVNEAKDQSPVPAKAAPQRNGDTGYRATMNYD